MPTLVFAVYALLAVLLIYVGGGVCLCLAAVVALAMIVIVSGAFARDQRVKQTGQYSFQRFGGSRHGS